MKQASGCRRSGVVFVGPLVYRVCATLWARAAAVSRGYVLGVVIHLDKSPDMKALESKAFHKSTRQLELRVAGDTHTLAVLSTIRVRITTRANHIPIQPMLNVLWDQTAQMNDHSVTVSN